MRIVRSPPDERALPVHDGSVTRTSTAKEDEIRTTVTRIVRGSVAVLGFAAVASATAVVAGASAPPVGPLPAGPTATVVTDAGELVGIALPRRSGGRVTLAFALTRGETAKALESRTFRVRVR